MHEWTRHILHRYASLHSLPSPEWFIELGGARLQSVYFLRPIVFTLMFDCTYNYNIDQPRLVYNLKATLCHSIGPYAIPWLCRAGSVKQFSQLELRQCDRADSDTEDLYICTPKF